MKISVGCDSKARYLCIYVDDKVVMRLDREEIEWCFENPEEGAR